MYVLLFPISYFISIQYSLGVKRDEMRKLEEIAQAEEKKLELAEQYLEEDAAMFDEFLRENDKNSVDAIQMWVLIFMLMLVLPWLVLFQNVVRKAT